MTIRVPRSGSVGAARWSARAGRGRRRGADLALDAGLELAGQDLHVRLRQHEPGIVAGYGVDLEGAGDELAPGQPPVLVRGHPSPFRPVEHHLSGIRARLVLLVRDEIG